MYFLNLILSPQIFILSSSLILLRYDACDECHNAVLDRTLLVQTQLHAHWKLWFTLITNGSKHLHILLF